MPAINIRKVQYDRIVREGDEPTEVVREAVSEWIERNYVTGQEGK